MIARAKEKPKAYRKKKKRAQLKSDMPEFKPEWVNAFLIMMLYKIGGVQALTLKQLQAYDKTKEGKEPEFSYDPELKAFVLKSPDYDMPIKLELPKKKIITNLNEAQNG